MTWRARQTAQIDVRFPRRRPRMHRVTNRTTSHRGTSEARLVVPGGPTLASRRQGRHPGRSAMATFAAASLSLGTLAFVAASAMPAAAAVPASWTAWVANNTGPTTAGSAVPIDDVNSSSSSSRTVGTPVATGVSPVGSPSPLTARQLLSLTSAVARSAWSTRLRTASQPPSPPA